MSPEYNGSQPLVSIGIPTYNRSKSLVRALESALKQDYQNIEIIISDNASSDSTEELCLGYASKHANVKYTRFHENQGAAENFRQVLKISSGMFFMWLADDDYLESNYISECVHCLEKNPELVVVGGRAVFIQNGQITGTGYIFDVTSNSAMLRVINYLWNVYDNSIFYGVMRMSVTNPEILSKNLADDWFYMAQIVVLGKAKTIKTTTLYRSVGGTSSSLSSMVKAAGISKINICIPGTMIALTAFRNILWEHHSYKKLNVATRSVLAVIVLVMALLRTGLYSALRRLIYYALNLMLGGSRYAIWKSHIKKHARAIK